MVAPLLLAAGASALGGLMSSQSEKDAMQEAAAAAAFNPYNVRGGGGSATFDPMGTIRMGDDEQSAMFRNLFAQQGQNLLQGGGFGEGAINFANTQGSQMMPGMFQGALDASSLGNLGQNVNAFSQYANQNAMLGQQMGMNQMGLANQFAQRQTGINEGAAQGLFSQGFSALGNTNQDQLTSQFIDRQRAFARPGEDRAVNSKFQNLFNRGILSSSGGERQIGDLAQAQEMADIQRVNAGEQFGNMVGQQNRQFGLGAIGAGFGARAQDQRFNQNAAQLFGNMGQGMMQFGAGQAQQGLGAQVAFNELGNTRGQQRLTNLTQLMGFGSGLQNQNMNQALGMFGGVQNLNQQQRQLAALGINAGSAGAAAGANQANYLSQTGASPFGSFLTGLGGGYMPSIPGKVGSPE